MGRGEQKSLNDNAELAKTQAADRQAKTNQLYSTLSPTLTAQATNPQGFAPGDLAAMNTASSQSLGGSTAGIVGQGNLEAARARNAGGFQASASEAGRQAMRQQSQNAVEIQGANAQQRERNRQTGIQGLTALYGGLDDASLKALGLSNDAYSKAASAYQNPFVSILNSSITAAGQAASGAGRGGSGD